MSARPSSSAGALCLGLLLLASGCALRTGDTERYFGPVLFRFSDPRSAAAHVSQVRRLGVIGEAGTQWGLGAGYAERIAVAPLRLEGADASPGRAAPRWSRPLSLWPAPEPGRWNLSLLYLQVTAAPAPVMVSRTVYGIEATAGADALALSVGAVSRTWSRVPDNALVRLHFSAARPLQSSLRVWAGAEDADLPPDLLLEEAPTR